MQGELGLRLLAAAIDGEQGIESFLRLSLNSDWMVSDAEQTAFQFVDGHIKKYGQLPARETIEEDAGVELPEATETPAYYADKLQERYLRREVKRAINKGQELFKQNDYDGARAHLLDEMVRLSMDQNRKHIVDYTTEAYSTVMDEYKAKWQLGDEYGIQLGYPTLDGMTGGLQPSDVFVAAGRPAAGKTYLLLKAAHHVWEHQKKVPLFLSMEMPILQITQRLSAMQAKVPITNLRHAALSTSLFKRLREKLGGIEKEGRPLWLVDGNLAASIEELRLYAQQLKPDVVFVDGAYLLHASGMSMKASNWEKVKAVIEGLKQQIAQALGIPVIASYQMNRDTVKNKAGTDLGTELLAYSDAIGQIASVVIGMMQEETVESLIQKKVSVLKGRNGESGDFFINWIFDTGPYYMNFDEVVPEQLADMKFT